jgi:hypothetical protein
MPIEKACVLCYYLNIVKSVNKENKNTKKILLIILLLGVSLAAIAVVLEKTGVTDFYQKNTPAPLTPGNTVNLDPPTEEESQAGDDQKAIIIQKQEAEAEQPSELTNEASVVIVDANQYGSEIEVRAFVSNIIEDGECTYTFTKPGSDTLSRTTPAYGDASSTPCISLKLDKSEFNDSGTWSLDVTYTNSTTTGSATTSLEIET